MNTMLTHIKGLMNFFQNIDDITMNIEENGVEISREIARTSIEKQSRAILAIAYQERKREDEPFSKTKILLLKLRSFHDGWKLESRFKINSAEEAEAIKNFIQKIF